MKCLILYFNAIFILLKLIFNDKSNFWNNFENVQMILTILESLPKHAISFIEELIPIALSTVLSLILEGT